MLKHPTTAKAALRPVRTGYRMLAGGGATVKGTMEKEIRCGNCNRLLARGYALALTIKCPRCGQYNHVRAKSPSAEGPRASPEFSRGHQPKAVSSAED